MPLDRHLAALATAVAIGATSLVVVLGLQNRSLETRYGEARRLATELYPGYGVPEFATATLEGDSVVLGAAPESVRQLLLVFDTECDYCRATVPAWKQVLSVLDSASYRPIQVLGISLDSDSATRVYLEDLEFALPTVTMRDPKTLQLYRLRSVPQTILLGPRGYVMFARTGQLSTPEAVDTLLQVIKRVAGDVSSTETAIRSH